jgi:hypothetical protein
LFKLRDFRPHVIFIMADRFGWRACHFRGNPIFAVRRPDVITFLLGWCVLSVIGTLIALSLIRTGKARQPDADETQASALQVAVVTAPARKR